MQLQSRRVVVMGLGLFGGGVGVTRFLVEQGARVLVTDQAPQEKLARSLAQLADLPVDYRLGGHETSDFTSADLIVVNPAVDQRKNVYLQAAHQAGVPTISEISLLVEHLPAGVRTVGITGSAGKSTTTAMLGQVLSKAMGQQHVHVGGNLGGSLLGKISSIKSGDWLVLELSSFMLEDMAERGWSPEIAIVTNLAANHLDRHGSFENYVGAKAQILRYQTPQQLAIFGPGVAEQMPQGAAQRVVISESAPDLPQLLTPGMHNRMNATLALSAAQHAGVSREQAMASLAEFAGLPHRMQFVGEHQSVRYFNDSKATTPGAAQLAIESFPAGCVHAIVGGYDKQSDLTALAQTAGRHCRAIYTIGTTGDAIADAAGGGKAQVHRCGTLDSAMEKIATRLQADDVVLLSPGCASWDQFENFEARGAAFVEAVLKYTGEGAAPVR